MARGIITAEWFAAYTQDGTCVRCQKTTHCVMFYETEVISPQLSIAMRSFCSRCSMLEAKEQLQLYGQFEIAKPKRARHLKPEPAAKWQHARKVARNKT